MHLMRFTKIKQKHQVQRWAQLAGAVLLSSALAAGFWAYTTPEMSLNWDSIASMCGF